MRADDVRLMQSKEVNISSWAQSDESVAYGISLRQFLKNGQARGILIIYIKNTSSTLLTFSRNEADSGVEIYYGAGNGAFIPLHDYSEKDEGLMQSQVSDAGIKPQEILRVSIGLNPQELNLLKSHPVQCVFSVYSVPGRQVHVVKTNPTLLTQ
jgi:hypothetical protein